MSGSSSWLSFALGTLLLWGVWGVLLKIAASKYSWSQVYVSSNLALLVVITVIALVYKPNILADKTVFLIALAAGFMGTLGYIFLVRAIERGPASIIVALTALYPALTAVFSYVILGEKLGVQKIIGILLAVLAILLLSK